MTDKSITIRKERFCPHPPEDVWAAITDPHALAEWMELAYLGSSAREFHSLALSITTCP